MEEKILIQGSGYKSQIAHIEQSLQQRWREENIYASPSQASEGDFKYVVGMFPYPSGNAHLGHALVYSITDTIARLERLKGNNVLHPLGWDSFGLPAENAAVKNNVAPDAWTQINIEKMRNDQIGPMGFSFNLDHEINTSDPEYYKWTQWLFLKMYEHGLVYRSKEWVNWDPIDQTVLANEQVIDGKGWRSGAPIERKQMEQWYIRITDFAEDLHNGLDTLTNWSEAALGAQRRWIGRKEGLDIKLATEQGDTLSSFTEAPKKLLGLSAIVLAPENPLIEQITSPDLLDAVLEFKKASLLKKAIDRASDKENEGIFTGSYALHPISGEKLPIYIADYVLDEYNNTVHLCSPSQDAKDADFCKKHAIKSVELSDVSAEEVSQSILDQNKATPDVRYRLRDWAIGRQRFWGAPIPMLRNENGEWLTVPEQDLPVLLPQQGKPESLAKNEDFKTVIQADGSKLTRETDTFDTFMCSSWYLWRFLSPNDSTQAWSPEEAKKWMPVDVYVGGLEHANQHMIYLRFMSHFLHKIGLTPTQEPIRAFLDNGMVQNGGKKMSKSTGNVVRPDEMIQKYGADALHMYILAEGPYNRNFEWSEDGLEQKSTFLSRLHTFYTTTPFTTGTITLEPNDVQEDWSKNLLQRLKQCMDGVENDILTRHSFHTAIAKMHDFANTLLRSKNETSSDESKLVLSYAAQSFLKALGTVAPHLSDALWRDVFDMKTSLFKGRWASVDPNLLPQSTVNNVTLMANGRKISTISVPNGYGDEDIINLVRRAQADNKFNANFNKAVIAEYFIVRDKAEPERVKLINLKLKR